MIWLGIWHTFLIGMCAAIIFVSISNNMWWGMHWPFPPMTLIGPRMSSMSIGVTLGLWVCPLFLPFFSKMSLKDHQTRETWTDDEFSVAFATLQQGFFFSNEYVTLHFLLQSPEEYRREVKWADKTWSTTFSSLILVVRIICYASVIGFIMFLYPVSKLSYLLPFPSCRLILAANWQSLFSTY